MQHSNERWCTRTVRLAHAVVGSLSFTPALIPGDSDAGGQNSGGRIKIAPLIRETGTGAGREESRNIKVILYQQPIQAILLKKYVLCHLIYER
jgi:hypothetical protein